MPEKKNYKMKAVIWLHFILWLVNPVALGPVVGQHSIVGTHSRGCCSPCGSKERRRSLDPNIPFKEMPPMTKHLSSRPQLLKIPPLLKITKVTKP